MARLQPIEEDLIKVLYFGRGELPATIQNVVRSTIKVPNTAGKLVPSTLHQNTIKDKIRTERGYKDLRAALKEIDKKLEAPAPKYLIKDEMSETELKEIFAEIDADPIASKQKKDYKKKLAVMQLAIADDLLSSKTNFKTTEGKISAYLKIGEALTADDQFQFELEKTVYNALAALPAVFSAMGISVDMNAFGKKLYTETARIMAREKEADRPILLTSKTEE
jgi:hypothetical protein